MTKRITMNILLTGTASAVVVGAALPFVSFLSPPDSGVVSGGGVLAKDALESGINKRSYLIAHNIGSRHLVQGLRGEPTYLIVKMTAEISRPML
jgi:cytochrome b6-f complex iron-sulfur subunit